MNDFDYKLDHSLIPMIRKINKPLILELGVQKGRSTKKFLDICEKNNGKLISVDIDDCSNVSQSRNWKFLKTKDDNFEFIKDQIKSKLDVLFIDTLHEAEHVKKLIYAYYPMIKKDGFIFIDDISHLPYLKNKSRNNFYCEINNKETFEVLLSIYSENLNNFDLSFSFISSGLAIIKKKNENGLKINKKVPARYWSFKNLFRILWKKVKAN